MGGASGACAAVTKRMCRQCASLPNYATRKAGTASGASDLINPDLFHCADDELEVELSELFFCHHKTATLKPSLLSKRV